MSSPFKQRFTSKSPLKQGAYESAADNDVYLSTQPQMQQVQNALAKIGVAAASALNDPKKKAQHQQRRIDRRNARALKKFGKDDLPNKDKGYAGSKEYQAFTATTNALEVRRDTNISFIEKKKGGSKGRFNPNTGKENKYDPSTGKLIDWSK